MSFTLQRGTDTGTRHAARPEPSSAAGQGIGRAATIALGVALAALCAGGLLLWARYGASVFFDLLSAGFSACL